MNFEQHSLQNHLNLLNVIWDIPLCFQYKKSKWWWFILTQIFVGRTNYFVL